MTQVFAYIPQAPKTALETAAVVAPRGPAWTQEQIDELTGLTEAAGEDRVQTGLDRTATGADRTQTGLDRIATSADRVATGEDRVQTGLDRTAAAGSASTATTKAGEAAATAAALAASSTALVVPFATWADLLAATLTNGQRTSVMATDTGTHTDPVAGAGTKNSGIYEKQAGNVTPVRIGSLDSTLSAASATAAEGFKDDAETAAAALADVLESVESVNLLDLATMLVTGSYVSGSNAIASNSEWSAVKIPKPTGATNIAWRTNTARRTGSTFLDASSQPLTGAYQSDGGLANTSYSRAWPTGAAFFFLNTKSNTISQPTEIMVNEGTVALPYVDWVPPYNAISEQAAQPAVDAAVEAAASYTDNTIDDMLGSRWHNYFEHGDFIGGDQSMRSASTVVDFTQAELLDLGLARGIQWRAGNDYARYDSGGSLLNTYFFAAQRVYSEDADNLPATATAFEEAAGGGLSNGAGVVYGYVEHSARLRTYWATGLIDTDVPKFLFGIQATPPVPGTRFAGDFTLFLADAAIDKDDALRQVYLADHARAQARKWAKSIVAGSNLAGARAVLTGSGGYVEAAHGGRTFRRYFQLSGTPTLSSPGLFNFLSDSVDGVTLRVCSDDIAPYRAFSPVRTVGANHGYAQTPITVSGGHSKTVADIGQRLSLGGVEYMIVGIQSATVVNMSPNSDSNDAVPSGTFTYVAGGSNTTGFTGTAGSADDMYPPYQSRQSRVLVDGTAVTPSNTEYRLTRALTVAESYDVLAKSEVMAWLAANGAGGSLAIAGRDPTFSVSNSYEFDTRANVTTYSDFVALKAMSLQDIMFVQAAKITDGIDGTISYFIANTLPVTHPSNGVTYNFAMIAVPDTSAWAGTRLNFPPASATGGHPDSVVMLGNTIGFAVGYLPVADTTQANRAINATVKYLQINDSGPAKVYMEAVDKGATALARGDVFSTISYRAFFVRDPKRTLQYPVFTRGADYFRVAWHNAAGLDRVPVPAEFAGRPFEIVRTAGGGTVSVKSKIITDSILFDYSAVGTYADIWLKIAK